MNIRMGVLISVFVFMLTGPSAFAQESAARSGKNRNVNFSVDLGTGVLRGHTTYQIGGKVKYADGTRDRFHFPLSELEFPLDVTLVSLGLSTEIKEKWKISLSAKKNITSDAGKMKDSDWGINDSNAPKSLDIYSESDAKLDALIINLDFRYKFINKTFRKNRLSFFMGAGYVHENFEYDISNLDQWYPSEPNRPHDTQSGKVLTYDIKYHIPYIKAGTTFSIINRFGIEGSIAYSPYLAIEDEDDHILRDKLSKGDLDGTAIMLSLEGSYQFTRHWFAKIDLNYMDLSADGKQKQYFYNMPGKVYFATIDQKIESEQLTAMLKAGYSF